MSEKERLLGLIRQVQREVKDISHRLASLEERVESFEGFEFVEEQASSSAPLALPIRSEPPFSRSPAPSRSDPTRAYSSGVAVGGLPSELEREDAARQTGRFFSRALSGLPRGDSGRARIKLQNNFYVVVRGANGTVYSDPVKVFSRFNLCRPHITVGNCGRDFGCSIFAGFCDIWEARLAVEEAGLGWPPSINL